FPSATDGGFRRLSVAILEFHHVVPENPYPSLRQRPAHHPGLPLRPVSRGQQCAALHAGPGAVTTAVAHPDDALASCRLRPGVHGVVIRRDLVLLDTRSDSYLCLPDIGPATLENGVLRSPRDVAAALQRDGLAGDDAGGTPDRVRPLPALP